MKPFFVSIPHSGERVPAEASWLHGLPEPLLMCDVDRFVDRLYVPVLQTLKIPFVLTEWHRYVIDLNRWKDDVDADSVEGHRLPSGKNPRGLHWVITTTGERLMPQPMSKALHESFVHKYFEPFHAEVRSRYEMFKAAGAGTVFHLDAHSMPSLGTAQHRDPGEHRADIVVSDCGGTSCSSWFKDLVLQSYEGAGFRVAYNWPYLGGRVTETYGQPALGQEAIQVELNRALYMNETSKAYLEEPARATARKIERALGAIHEALPNI